MTQVNNMDKPITKEDVLSVIRDYEKSSAFIARKLTDTPNDMLSVVNKKFVTLNGVVASRPKSSVASVGQHYFATDTKIPMTYDTTGWVNGVGSIVAQNQ